MIGVTGRLTPSVAGRVAPGAIAELLRNGERQDQAVTDPSGQFVMVPPRLPPGSYELNLTSKLPDGTLAERSTNYIVARGQMILRDSPWRPVGSARPRPFCSAGFGLCFASIRYF